MTSLVVLDFEKRYGYFILNRRCRNIFFAEITSGPLEVVGAEDKVEGTSKKSMVEIVNSNE